MCQSITLVRSTAPIINRDIGGLLHLSHCTSLELSEQCVESLGVKQTLSIGYVGSGKGIGRYVS